MANKISAELLTGNAKGDSTSTDDRLNELVTLDTEILIELKEIRFLLTEALEA